MFTGIMKTTQADEGFRRHKRELEERVRERIFNHPVFVGARPPFAALPEAIRQWNKPCG
jgi:hypothetical protein